jgi:hypothetical protein
MPTKAVRLLDTPGVDQGEAFFAFSSSLPPTDAVDGYVEQLLASGYALLGSDGRWSYLRRPGEPSALAVAAGASGPPSTLVRVADARRLSAALSARDHGR